MKFLHAFCLVPLLAAVALTPTSRAQTPATTYDVSTVKPASPGKGGMMLNWGSARMKAENVTLGWIMTSALHARPDQITGEPAWADDQHWDIDAKLTDIDEAAMKKMTPEQHRMLLLALLVERFGLKYHVETREMPVYNLEPAKGGLKLKPADSPDDKDKQVYGACNGCIYMEQNGARAHNIEFKQLPEILAGVLHRDVIDKTGYTRGNIDLNLKWLPDVGTKPDNGAEDVALLPLPAALEQTLGLHLAPTRGPVKVYVIDHLDKPSAN